ncbi:hypothetical protein ACE1ET_20230 [Saccharicrinis sp. FJH62]|uniref:hypothetical protein n=1 Tax=Saccharicrinis sp. FJH62 TaxID=3344657 RepID=UPI0035D40174
MKLILTVITFFILFVTACDKNNNIQQEFYPEPEIPKYNTFINIEKKWIISTKVEGYNPWDNYTLWNLYYFKGDSIINDTKYHALYRKRFYYKSQYGDYEDDSIENAKFYAFIREDTIEKKVYFTRYSDNKEFVLFNFNLEVGATFEAPTSIWDIKVRIDSINFLILQNGDSTKCFYCSYKNDIGDRQLCFYIEGIGGNGGILNPFNYNTAFAGSGSTFYIDEVNCVQINSNCIFGDCDYPNKLKLDATVLKSNYKQLMVGK